MVADGVNASFALKLLLGQLGLSTCLGLYFERHHLAERRFVKEPIFEALVRVESRWMNPGRAFANSSFLSSLVLFCKFDVQRDVRICQSIS